MSKKDTKYFEGFTSKVFQEDGGRKSVPTVGSGINVSEPHNIKLIPKDVISGKRAITPEENQRAYLANKAIAQSDSKKFIGTGYADTAEDAIFVTNDLHYNMGSTRMKKFKGYRKAIQEKDYDRAAEELKWNNPDTKKKLTPYWTQTKSRAKEHYKMLKNIKNNRLEAEMLRQLGG